MEQEILKVLAEGAMAPGEIRNRLNSNGWDVSLNDVMSALLSLLKEGQVAQDKRIWRSVKAPE